MNEHDALHKLVEAENMLMQIRELSNTPEVIRLVDLVHNHIYSVGDSLWPRLAAIARKESHECA